MNSNINKENQNITIIDRKELKITGVNKIESLNDKEFLVKTINGNITICGENLEMKHLDLERQILQIIGTINSLVYDSHEQKKEKKGNFFGKLFK